ncbi:MAG: transcription antitermination factor NusB [Cyanobacteria bacterium P01_D01_bin.36]
MKARSIARELALLGASQISDSLSTSSRAAVSRGGGREVGVRSQITDKPTTEQLDALLLKALTILGADAQETIETAEGELLRGERLVLESETRTVESKEVRDRILPAIPLVEAAINRVGETLELLMFAQQDERKGMISAQDALKAAAKSVEVADQLMADHENKIVDIERVRSQIQDATSTVKTALIGIKKALVPEYLKQLISHEDVRSYACDLLYNWIRHWRTIDVQLDDAMEKWNIRRLARVDRDILRIAMLEIVHLDVPIKVAIDEAVEMAKRYSDEEGYRFINGVLRRTTDKLEKAEQDA